MESTLYRSLGTHWRTRVKFPNADEHSRSDSKLIARRFAIRSLRRPASRRFLAIRHVKIGFRLTFSSVPFLFAADRDPRARV